MHVIRICHNRLMLCNLSFRHVNVSNTALTCCILRYCGVKKNLFLHPDSLSKEKEEVTSTAATEPTVNESSKETAASVDDTSSSSTTEKKPPIKFKKVKLKPQKKQPVDDESDDEGT